MKFTHKLKDKAPSVFLILLTAYLAVLISCQMIS